MNKFNEHILLVMRWLQNNDSVSEEELKANSTAAYAAYVTHNAPYAAPYAAAEANDVAANAAYAASYAGDDAYVATRATRTSYNASNADDDAKHWLSKTKKYLDEYFETTKKDRKAYEERAKYLNILGAKNG